MNGSFTTGTAQTTTATKSYYIHKTTKLVIGTNRICVYNTKRVI